MSRTIPYETYCKYFILGDITVGRGAQPNLREEEHKKEQGWRVQRVFRQLQLPGNHLLSRPNKEKDRRAGLEHKRRPLLDCTERQDRENQKSAQADNEHPLQGSGLAIRPGAPDSMEFVVSTIKYDEVFNVPVLNWLSPLA